MNKLWLLIIGMMLVTYIPRLLPFVIISKDKLPVRARRFLQFIPCTALGAMIVPGVFSSIPNKPEIALLGITFALIYSWFKGGILVPVLGSIFVCFLGIMLNI